MMIPRKLLFLGGLLGLTIAITISGANAYAATEPRESITLSPVSKSYNVSRGEVVHDNLTILNDGDTTYNFTVYGTPYSVSNGSYNPSFETTKPDADAYTWVSFERTTYRIKPRQTIEVPFTMNVRADASPGGHYGAIMAEVQPGEDSGQLARKKRVPMLLYVTVKGDVKLAGSIDAISIPWYQTVTPMKATAAVRNTGNTDFVSTIDYKVSTVFGRDVYDAKREYTVLPNTTRDLDMSWNNASWFGLYKVNLSVDVLGKTTEVSSLVLMMPIWMVVLILIFIVVGGAYAVSGRARRKARRSK